MSFSNFNANINCKLLNVVIMMRMTCSSLCNFYENVDKSTMKHLSPWWKERVPRQHPGSGNSIEMLVQRNKCGDVRNLLEMVG